MARPRVGEFDKVWQFMCGLSEIVEDRCMPDHDEDEGIEVPEPRLVFDWLFDEWENGEIGVTWQRVLMAGQVAIDNACDPDCGHLAFKPEIIGKHALLALMIQGKARWEAFAGSPNKGEVCIDGLRYCATLGEDGCPEIHSVLLGAIKQAAGPLWSK